MKPNSDDAEIEVARKRDEVVKRMLATPAATAQAQIEKGFGLDRHRRLRWRADRTLVGDPGVNLLVGEPLASCASWGQRGACCVINAHLGAVCVTVV